MYPQQQYERRPAPVLIVLMILGIVIFTLVYGIGKPGDQTLSAPPPAVTQPAPTLVPATPDIERTADVRREDTYQRDAEATEVWRAQEQQEAELMAKASYAQTMTANQATALAQKHEHENQMVQAENERALTNGLVSLAAGLAAVVVLMALALTVRVVLEAQQKASEAAADRAEQERLLLEARRLLVETRTRPAYQPAMRLADKPDTKLEPLPMNGKNYHTDWTKKAEVDEKKIKKFPLAG